MLKAKKSKSSTKSTKKIIPISSYFQAGVFKDRSLSKKIKLLYDNNNNGLTPPVTKLNKQTQAVVGQCASYNMCKVRHTVTNRDAPALHSGASYKFPKRKVSGINRECTTRLF